FHRDSRGHRSAFDLFEVIKAPANREVTRHVAPPHMDGAVVAGCAQISQQDFLDHFRGRFSPALKFIGAQLLGTVAVDNAVLAIHVGGHDRADDLPDWNRARLFNVPSIRGNGELIILDGACGAAAGEQSNQQHKSADAASPGREARSSSALDWRVFRTAQGYVLWSWVLWSWVLWHWAHCRSPGLCSGG